VILEAELLKNKTGLKLVEEFEIIVINTIEPKFEEYSKFCLDN